MQAALAAWPPASRLYIALDTTALTPSVLIRVGTFLDEKSGGFQLQTSELTTPESLERLLLIVALATLHLTMWEQQSFRRASIAGSIPIGIAVSHT